MEGNLNLWSVPQHSYSECPEPSTKLSIVYCYVSWLTSRLCVIARSKRNRHLFCISLQLWSDVWRNNWKAKHDKQRACYWIEQLQNYFDPTHQRCILGVIMLTLSHVLIMGISLYLFLSFCLFVSFSFTNTHSQFTHMLWKTKWNYWRLTCHIGYDYIWDGIYDSMWMH